MQFKDKKVFITGASRGIGYALAQSFRDKGARVVGTCTNNANIKSDVCHEWIVSDFNDVEQIEACAEKLRELKPDILINNAGINKIAPFTEITSDDFLSIQQVNVFAPFMLCQAAIPSMKNNNWGRIINISSIWGKISKEHRASYSSSKFALDGMTLALAAEHTVDGIIANCIAPGFFDTELTRDVLGEEGMYSLATTVPIRRVGQIDEISHLVLWLASEENTYLAGQNIAIDGGFSRV